MDKAQLYRDIATRTGGDIYIGVVGPVRTGKSTFVKRFSELMMLPNIAEESERRRVTDELPQSGTGRSIMTTQPHFVPNEAVRVDLGENVSAKLRLVDCVGYLIPDAIGHLENEQARMVTTPWFPQDIPFEEAAAIGTQKVIGEHATIGVVMTTDGSITEIPREAYRDAEARAIEEVRQTGKPFIVVVNSTQPDGDKAKAVVSEIKTRFSIDALPLNVLNMDERALTELVTELLFAFPFRLIELRLPGFMRALDASNPLMGKLIEAIQGVMGKLKELRDWPLLQEALTGLPRFTAPVLTTLSPADGSLILTLQPEEGVFYEVLSDATGLAIDNDCELMSALKDFVAAKREYDRIAGALDKARQTGYGIVSPALEEMELLDPEITRQGSRFGVRLHARASGLHLIRVDIDSEVNPIVGTEQQSEALVQYLTDTFADDPKAIWQTNLFGKSLYDLVVESMQGKVVGMSEQVQERMQYILQRIVNNGCNGLICILL